MLEEASDGDVGRSLRPPARRPSRSAPADEDRVQGRCCRHCGQILLMQLPGLMPGPREYAEKVILHEEHCAGGDER